MKARVLHLVDSFRDAGSERQCLQLAQLLKHSSEYEVHLAALSNEGPLRPIAESDFPSVPVYALTSFYDRNAASQMKRFAGLLREKNIDIVHSHCFYTNIFGMFGAALAGVQVRIASRRESSKKPPAKRLIERFAYRRAHAVVANCEEVRRQLVREHVPEEKVITLYNGFDVERVSANNLTRADALSRLGLPDGPRFITIVANLREVKDHATFIRAARLVQDQVPDASFLIAGEGPRLDVLKSLAASLQLQDHIYFLGRCERIAELLFISDVCVLSSRSEGFPNAVVEYMAAGRPVVATSVGGVPEAVANGETGFLVTPGNEAQMAQHIVTLLENPALAATMGKCGELRAREEFSAERRLLETDRLYQRLLTQCYLKKRRRLDAVLREG